MGDLVTGFLTASPDAERSCVTVECHLPEGYRTATVHRAVQDAGRWRYRPVRGATMAEASDDGVVIVLDYEAPLNVTVSYRVAAYRRGDDGLLYAAPDYIGPVAVILPGTSHLRERPT